MTEDRPSLPLSLPITDDDEGEADQKPSSEDGTSLQFAISLDSATTDDPDELSPQKEELKRRARPRQGPGVPSRHDSVEADGVDPADFEILPDDDDDGVASPTAAKARGAIEAPKVFSTNMQAPARAPTMRNTTS